MQKKSLGNGIPKTPIQDIRGISLDSKLKMIIYHLLLFKLLEHLIIKSFGYLQKNLIILIIILSVK